MGGFSSSEGNEEMHEHPNQCPAQSTGWTRVADPDFSMFKNYGFWHSERFNI
jgi:hypothetical protein